MGLSPQRTSVLLLCAILLLCLYRAATQSFTIDESFTFLKYVDVPLLDAFREYSSNNHILQSLLMRVFRDMLGKSELVLRIPTRIGCALFLTASYRITLKALGNRWAQPLALLLMTLNPLVLDFQVAARGYGMALGLFWWALYFLWSGRLRWAGICAGLAITANLVFLIPLVALGLLLLPVYAKRSQFWDLMDGYAGPAAVICFVFLVIPLTKSAGEVYFGAPTLTETVASLVGQSLRPLADASPAAEHWIIQYAVPLAFLWIAGAFLWRVVRPPEDMLLTLLMGTMLISILAWIVMHHFLGVVYPVTRTALYMLPLLGLTLILSAAGSLRFVSHFLYGVGIFIGAFYLLGLRTSYFAEWRSESAMDRLVQRLAQDAGERLDNQFVTVGGSWDLEYSIRYYRARYRLHRLHAFDAAERQSKTPDYYLLGRDDAQLVEQLHLKVIEKDDVSGTLLARRS